MEPWVPGSRLDRIPDGRADVSTVAAWWADPSSRVFGVDDRSFVTSAGGELRRERPAGPYVPDRHLLVGLVDGRAWFVVEASDVAGRRETSSLRELAGRLDETMADVVTTGVTLVNWHRVAPHCGMCGAMTEVREGGHQRWCPQCERPRFPRTDPAVIVAVLDDDDRLLLAHQRVWDAGRVSLLAGFVESGESLEQAVHREIAEESDLTLTSLRYVGSQPWPFPRSLMLGFVARASGTEITVDGDEIAWARFFTRDDLDAAVAAGEVSLPANVSIASRIIAEWRAGRLDA